MSAVTWIDSPSRAVDGETSRSTSASSRPPRPTSRVSTWIPRAAARAASLCPDPVVSLPSESSTIRFWASSGNSAVASRSAAPMSVADFTGVDAIRSISPSSEGSRSTSASPPNATIPATSSSALAASASRTYASVSSRPCVPTESDRSTTNTTASRSTGSTSWSPASANTRADSSPIRIASAARRRPAPRRRREPTWSRTTSATSGGSRRSASGASNVMPITRPGRSSVHCDGPASRRCRGAAARACRARRPATPG